ncbi:transposable element tc3 transposase protein [Rutstroemia sp. NJR-2017a BBW]|nr:transposable element tc3 transposase protein [Rutstroemia sp. NJR-2017a BBW]
MPPQRTSLTPISGNRVKGGELTKYERGLIVGTSIGGLTPREIEIEFNTSRGAVRRTLELQHIHQDGDSLPRLGAKLRYSPRDRHALLAHIRKYPKATFDQQRKDLGLKMSNTLHGITYWHAKKRPELKQEHADTRLLWCQCRAHWDAERWKDYMWSDKCSAERGRGKVVE